MAEVTRGGRSRRRYREVFFAAFGMGPYECYLCHEGIGFMEVHVHHHNGDETCDHPLNLVPVHRRCHARLHRHSPETIAKLTQPPRECVICKQVTKRISKGRCGACGAFFRRTGQERFVDGQCQAKLRGRKFTAEHRAKISAANKRAWAEGRRG